MRSFTSNTADYFLSFVSLFVTDDDSDVKWFNATFWNDNHSHSQLHNTDKLTFSQKKFYNALVIGKNVGVGSKSTLKEATTIQSTGQ